MTQVEFDRKWAHMLDTHTAECDVTLGNFMCTCSLRGRRAQRYLDEMTIGREERHAKALSALKADRRRAQTRSAVRNVTALATLAFFTPIAPITTAALLTLCIGGKTFNWAACAYGLLPSNWLDPGDATRGPLGWARAMLLGVH